MEDMMVKQARVTVYWDDEASLVMDIAESVGAVECDDSDEVNHGCFFCPSGQIFEEFSAMLQEAGIRFSRENSN